MSVPGLKITHKASVFGSRREGCKLSRDGKRVNRTTGRAITDVGWGEPPRIGAEEAGKGKPQLDWRRHYPSTST